MSRSFGVIRGIFHKEGPPPPSFLESERDEIWASVVHVVCIYGYCWYCTCRGLFDVIRCTFSKIGPITPKRAHPRAKQRKMWALCLYVACILVIFQVEHVNKGHLGCTFCKKGCNAKSVHRRAKWMTVWSRESMLYACGCFLPWTCQGHSVHLYQNSQTGHCRETTDKNLDLRVYVACILVFLTLDMSRSFGIIWCIFFWK